MYEPIRTKSVHSTTAGRPSDFPHRSREEELDIQLAGHLAALLAVTDELRASAPSTELDTAADRLAGQVARLRGGPAPARLTAPADALDPTVLHQRAQALAGRALVVAASRADTAAAILSAERIDAHAAALHPQALAAR
ncbi:hypothetical protein ACIQKE_16175 [Streptomyces griseoviridis]|uniref:Uncharacterized protein n=2 Tax=Streptomyces TaxID=1883 RepID=A0A3S9ZC20_STRGD|nr:MULTISPECIES: hypothetical protein [Streptomyces]AZS85351.1 hypothetical protein ELQ87_14355 [Streptomyces griseoviridis]MDH6699062.1 hypothetical protein [Streptomyces sp. MAA16]MDT0476172.1 hypothetical protein [Streptomyces sp. DSM 41014]QCN87797.1 hypothetical protein DDJ31_24940 [Streptomyces griseoviridis]